MTLKKIRQNCNLSQKEISDKLSVNRSTYAMWELKKAKPGLDMLPKLAEVLNVSVETILECFK